MERAAVIDPHDELALVLEVRDLHVAREGKVLVRGADAHLVIDLAVRGLLAVEAGSVPGGKALLRVGLDVSPDLVALALYRIVLVAYSAVWLIVRCHSLDILVADIGMSRIVEE